MAARAGLSFIELAPLGLFPHDLVREALSFDLRWQHPERYAELFSRARAYYSKRIMQTQGPELERTLFDYIFLSPRLPDFEKGRSPNSALHNFSA